MATYLLLNGKLNKLNFDRQGLLVDELSLLLRIQEFLSDCGLQFEVTGSYVEEPNAEHGDIDIRVEYVFDKSGARVAAITGLERFVGDIKNADIIESSHKKQDYVGTVIDYRFRIRDSVTGATIDLCFEAEKEFN